MSEESIKQRFKRAKQRAIRLLSCPPGTYTILISNGNPFHIEAIREKETRKIRIVLDEIKEEDERLVRAIKLPDMFTKEIWLKRFDRKDFKIKRIS